MSKLLIIFTLLFGYLTFQLPIAFAENFVKVGPVKLIVPAGQPIGSLKVNIQIKDKSGNITNKTLGSGSSSETKCSNAIFERQTGPCLPEQSVSISNNNEVHLTITGVERWIKDSSGSWVKDENGTSQFQTGEDFSSADDLAKGKDLGSGGSTKWVMFSWTPKTSIPTLKIEPKVQFIPKGQAVTITAEATKPFASSYEFKVVHNNDKGEAIQKNIGLIPIECQSEKCFIKETAFVDQLKYTFEQQGDGWRLITIVGASVLKPSSIYMAYISYQGTEKKDTFSTEGFDQSVIKLKLEPGEYSSGESTKGQTLKVTIDGATEQWSPNGDTYKAEVVDKSSGDKKCNTRPCELSIDLGSGLEGSTIEDKKYPVTVSGPNNIRATAYLLVKQGKTASGHINPGDPGFGGPSVKCVNGVDTNGKPCTSSGGIQCDPNHPLDDNGQPQGTGGIYTAIGCVPTEPQKLIQGLFRVGVGLGGAAALLLMIGGAFQFITSAGNPDALKSATETFTQAIIGLLVIIFAVLLLQVIGVDILNIPGFSK